jgi:hypothetical protein
MGRRSTVFEPSSQWFFVSGLSDGDCLKQRGIGGAVSGGLFLVLQRLQCKLGTLEQYSVDFQAWLEGFGRRHRFRIQKASENFPTWDNRPWHSF